MQREFSACRADDVVILGTAGAVLAVSKPAGMLVHNSRYATTGTRELALTDALRDRVGAPCYPLHRLDRQTSGVLLFTTERARVHELMTTMKRGASVKTYLALVRGHLQGERAVDHDVENSGGRKGPARSLMTPVLSSLKERVSLVEAALVRGRYHQVRRHIRHLNHPVVLDRQHGDRHFNRDLATRLPLARLALHAWTLHAVIDDEPLRFVAPLPADLAATFAQVFGDVSSLALDDGAPLPTPEVRAWLAEVADVDDPPRDDGGDDDDAGDDPR